MQILTTRAAVAATAATSLAALGLGLFAGSVAGDDGASEPAQRIAGSYGAPLQQRAEGDGAPPAVIAAGRGRGRPKVQHGSGQPVPIAAGEASAISLRCPKGFAVPISAGLETSIPGIFLGLLTRDRSNPRAMLVAAVNQTASAGEWTATIACMKGAKEAG